MSQPRVLIVDDDERICKFLEMAVSSWSMIAKSMINPFLVANEIKRSFYNVILLDVFMPEMNGMDLLAEIHPLCHDTKIIIVTGYADKENAIKALSLGAFDFLEKPVTVDLLYYTVKRALDIQGVEIEHRKTLEKFNEKSKELIETIEALSVLVKNIDVAKKEMEKMIILQFRSLLAPIMENLRNERDSKIYESQLAMLSSYVEDLTADLSTNLQAKTSFSSLSFRELQIAMMIKNDMTNEDIAAHLHISLETVRTHRRNMRKKLGIMGTKTRLNTYLWALEGNALRS